MKPDLSRPYVKMYKLCAGGVVRRNSPQLGHWLRTELTSMGPTYVKLGQIVSTRKDIFPIRVTKPLEELRENVTAVDFESMDSVFKDAYGESSRTFFKNIDTCPIACASISQVYRAKLHNNRIVVVKIQKPGIRELIAQDISAIHQLLTMCSTLVPSKTLKDLLLVTNELAISLTAEIDFVNEMKNIQRFRTIQYDQLIIPRVYAGMVRSTVLIMEDVQGARLDKSSSDASNTIMLLFIRCLIEQGLLHADMHAGNIAISKSGSIIWYDFGSVLSYDVDTRNAFKRILRGFLFKNTNDIIDCVLENEFIHLYNQKALTYQELDPETYVVLYTLLDYTFSYTKDTDVISLVNKITTDPFVSVGSLPFYVDNKLILLFKSITSLEGVCKDIDSEFSYDALYTNLIRNLIDVDFVSDKITHDIRWMADQSEGDNVAYAQEMKSKVFLNRSHNVNYTQVILFFGLCVLMIS